MAQKMLPQPLNKLPPVQLKVYEAIKAHQPISTNDLADVLKRPAKSMTSALMGLRKKELVVFENSLYTTTSKAHFDVRFKKEKEEPPCKFSHIEDQIAWNEQVLKQKALREVRMRINL
jgi:hypothetical protein